MPDKSFLSRTLRFLRNPKRAITTRRLKEDNNRKVLNALSEEALSAEKIVQVTGISWHQLRGILLRMEENGQIIQHGEYDWRYPASRQYRKAD